MTGPKLVGGIADNLVIDAAIGTMAARMQAIDPGKPRDQREIEASEAMAPLALAHARGIVLNDGSDKDGGR